MEQFIQNILIGVRQWVNGKLEDITYVISSHINELTGRVTALEEAGGQANVIEGVKVNGTDLAVDANKKVNVTVAEGSTNGTVAVNGTDVAVHGLGSAAYTASTDYATAAQGATADTAIQSISAADNSVTVSAKGSGTTQTVAVKISADSDNALSLESDGLKVAVPAATVTGVKSGEKIIGLNGTELTSTVTLNYDSASTKLQLLGIGGTLVSEINASAFIKDGMLDYAALHVRTTVSDVTTWTPALPAGTSEPSGTVDGTYIVLVWNTESGKSATFINVTSLIDTYTAGTGLTLSNHEFSLNAATASTIGGVKVAAAATSGLTLAADGSLSIDGPSVAQILALLDSPETPAAGE